MQFPWKIYYIHPAKNESNDDDDDDDDDGGGGGGGETGHCNCVADKYYIIYTIYKYMYIVNYDYKLYLLASWTSNSSLHL